MGPTIGVGRLSAEARKSSRVSKLSKKAMDRMVVEYSDEVGGPMGSSHLEELKSLILGMSTATDERLRSASNQLAIAATKRAIMKNDIDQFKTDIVYLKNKVKALKSDTEKLNTENQLLREDLRKAMEVIGGDLAIVRSALVNADVPSATSPMSPSPETSPAHSYALVLTRSIQPSSSASHAVNAAAPKARESAINNLRKSNVLLGMTIDTRRVKDKECLQTENTKLMESRIQQALGSNELTKDVMIQGIQMRGDNLRILTANERDAAVLRINDRWVNQLFEGARTRGEDWYPIKIDDVVKAVVVKEDNHTIKEDFGKAFCEENGLLGITKAFWLSKGNKLSGSMVVFLVNADDAQRMLNNRIVKVGGQVAFANEYHRIARPTRCYNCNKYGHFQSRCVHATACGNCSGSHPTDQCTSTEKKCPACGEAHTVTDPRCPVYKRERANIARVRARLAAQAPTSISYD